MRLNNLEEKITSVTNSNESLHTSSTSYSDMKTDEIENKVFCAESVILAAVEKLNDCKYAFNLLKTHRNNILSNEFNTLENNLSELGTILNSNINENEVNVVYSSASAIVRQLETLLREKLRSLHAKRKSLEELKQLDDKAKLEIFAEKIAYENVIVDRIHQALSTFSFSDNSARLLFKESIETMNLLYNLSGKLSGTIKKQIPHFYTSVDSLTKVLTKRLLAAAHGYTLRKQLKNNLGSILIRLEEEQTKINSLMNTYKLHKLPQLADALAFETINVKIPTTEFKCALDDSIIDGIWKTARETINCELIESEINHIMMQTAQRYEEKSSSDENYFFSFFAHERATLELWSDSVETQLQLEMDRNIEELVKMFKFSLSKLQRQNWRKRLESEWSNGDINTLLSEFADVISHKSLVDARIQVLKSEYKIVDNDSYASDDNRLLIFLQTDQQCNHLQEVGLMNINQTLEAEFKCMLTQYKMDCENSLVDIGLIEVKKSLQDLSLQILDIVNYYTSTVIEDTTPIITLHDVTNRCEQLKRQLVDLKQHIMRMKDINR